MPHQELRTPEHRISAPKRDLGLPVIVAICGSTRFMAQMNEAELRETFAGRIVVKPACDLKNPHPLWANPARAERLKADLGELHRAKIHLADEVLVVGDSTRSEIRYGTAGGSESGSNKGPCPDESEDGSDHSARGDTAGPRSVGVGHHLEPVGYPSDIGSQKPPAHESDATPHQLEHLTVHDARIVSLRRW